MARKNQFIDIPTSSVTINSIEIIRCDLPSFDVLVNCEKGTYIRALARDIGAKLGVGGYLSALRRTKIGEYNADESVRIQELENLIVNI
jgi:tRNA pseudouridine55 synthase